MKKVLIILFIIFPLLAKAQKFSFKEDGSSETVVYQVDKPAKEIYNDVVAWTGKYFMMPENALKESVTDKMIKLEGSYWNPLDIDINAYKQYIAKYILIIEFSNGGYSVKYIHNKFTKNREEQPLTVKDVVANSSNSKEWKRSKKNYEFKVNNTLASLNHFIKTSEFIEEPIEYFKITVPGDFKLNPYDSTAVYEFKVNKTAAEIYKDVHQLIKNDYVVSPTFLKDSVRVIQFKTGKWRTFNKKFRDKNGLNPFSSDGILTFEIKDGTYTLIYKHTGFTYNSEPVALNLPDLYEDSKKKGKFYGAWANYEYRIYETFELMNHFITTGEFIKKRN